MIYVIFYALGFFALAVISREWLLCIVAIPLLTGFVILMRPELLASGGEFVPALTALWVGVLAGTAGRVTAMLFAIKDATIPIGVALASGPILFLLLVAAIMRGV